MPGQFSLCSGLNIPDDEVLTHTGDNADKIFPTISVDGAGQVHVMVPVRFNDDPEGFAATGQENPATTALLLVTSPDGGSHWTPPFRLHPAVKGSEFFPWIAAGSAGVLDAVYYASRTRKPNDPSSRWFIAFSQVRGAVAEVVGDRAKYTQTPQVSNTLLDPQTVHVGGICTFGIFCLPGTNRNLADSIAVALDPAGGANATYTVDAPGQIGQDEDSHIEFTCQSSGRSAFDGMPDLSGCYGST